MAFAKATNAQQVVLRDALITALEAAIAPVKAAS